MVKHRGFLTLTIAAGILLLAATVPGAHAYGNTAQWQIGFSGNCHDVTTCHGTGGFWGWCEFGGSSGSTAPGTTGTSGDCQVTTYNRSALGEPNNPVHQSVDIHGWTIKPSFMSPTGFSFQITSAALECTGPGASTGCVLPPGGDTGLPPVAGHYSFSPFPGLKINIQVNQLP